MFLVRFLFCFFEGLLANQTLELRQVADREIGHLSGGELQRFAIGLVCVQKADVYVNFGAFK
jgi:translation initiation factor RLI1